MKLPPKTQRLLFYLIVLVMTATILAAFILAFSWINKPFAGFLTYEFPYVGPFGLQTWSSQQAGLYYLDRVLEVEGRPLIRGADLIRMIEEKPPGTMMHYLADSRGLRRMFSIPVSLFSTKDFILVFMVPFLAGIIIYLLGAIVYYMKPETSSSWIFLLTCFFMGTYSVTGFDYQTTYALSILHVTMIPMMAGALFHLGLVFPYRKLFLNRHPWVEYLIYLFSGILILLYQIYLFSFEKLIHLRILPWFPSFPGLTAVNRIFALLCLASMIGLVTHAFLKAPDYQSKQRARFILLGVILTFSPWAILPLLAIPTKIQLPWNFLSYTIIFFPSSIAYSIIRHNLFDADTIIKRTVGYAVVTTVVIGSYLILSLTMNYMLGQYEISRSRMFPILFTLLIVLIFNPLRNWVQSLVDRIFFRKDYDPKQIIERLGSAMASLMDLPQILQQLVTTFNREMFIDNSAVLLLNTSGSAYQVRLAEGDQRQHLEGVTFQKTEPLPQVIEKAKKEITKYDVLEDPKYREICLECAQNFSTLYSSLIIPMLLRGEVIGFMSLGDKKSGKFYNGEDIDLLRTLATQGAVAIENARMAEQMKNEELVRTNLARYLSPQIVDQIIKQDVKVNLGGDRKEVTVLFSDIRNFTSISESMRPEQLVEFLNEYFTEMARIIFANQGSLDKYIGDAIVAVFGSLIALENPAEAAVKASIEMMQEMARLNEKWKERYGFNMEMGIGINTGEVFLGNIGSPERMEFTVIGDTVNTASRFSGLAKGRQILATRSAKDRLGPQIGTNQLPSTKVKGKAEEVEVFDILYE
jgi:adenylate cyclase